MKDQLRVDTLFAAAATGSLSRRDLVRGATALGFGTPAIAALLGAQSAGAQTGPSNLSLVWGPPGFTTWGFSNEAFDAEMEAALRTYDREEQAAHYQEAIRILNDEAPWVWLFNRQNLIAVNTSRLTTGDSLAWGPGHLMYMNHPYDWTVQE